MLQLQEITVYQFKNYTDRSFRFLHRITGICGSNGTGKTNLLDAIHYLCFTRSYFTRLDAAQVLHGASGFRLEGKWQTGADGSESEKAVCIFRENGRKEFLVNDTAYEKFSLHIGRYPCVVIAPDDAELITGNSDERRKFLDALLSQLDAGYLQDLISYTRLLQQRNSLLKSYGETGSIDRQLLDVLDHQLSTPGDRIYQYRKNFMETFIREVLSWYFTIAGKKEPVSINYESELHEQNMATLLATGHTRDLLAQRTTRGIHRDELQIRLGDQLFRQTASQGQRKSLLFALKLAELEILKKEKGFPPVLLLDDVFEKLDDKRIGNLLEKVCVENQGQVFITDTSRERLSSQLASLGIEFGILEV